MDFFLRALNAMIQTALMRLANNCIAVRTVLSLNEETTSNLFIVLKINHEITEQVFPDLMLVVLTPVV